MNSKHLKEFNSEGFTIFRNLLSKSEINLFYSQLECMIDTIIKYNKVPIKKNANFNEKYLMLKKTSPNLKSRFYDMMQYLDCVGTIAIAKILLENGYCVEGILDNKEWHLEKRF